MDFKGNGVCKEPVLVGPRHRLKKGKLIFLIGGKR